MEIITERLVLRDFVPADWPAVLAYQSDPRYLRFYAWEGRTPAEVQAFVGRFIEHQAQQPRIKFQLAVTLKSNGQLIGNCGIRKDTVEASEADLGYELAPEHWGRGYASEAARAMLRFGFIGLGVHRVWASCVAENTASAHVLEKIGMRLEGRLREKEYYKGRWWDTLLYAVLAQEWQDASEFPKPG